VNFPSFFPAAIPIPNSRPTFFPAAVPNSRPTFFLAAGLNSRAAFFLAAGTESLHLLLHLWHTTFLPAAALISEPVSFPDRSTSAPP
jgi:hypothetical protein